MGSSWVNFGEHSVRRGSVCLLFRALHISAAKRLDAPWTHLWDTLCSSLYLNYFFLALPIILNLSLSLRLDIAYATKSSLTSWLTCDSPSKDSQHLQWHNFDLPTHLPTPQPACNLRSKSCGTPRHKPHGLGKCLLSGGSLLSQSQ